jgi:hypothetical protein
MGKPYTIVMIFWVICLTACVSSGVAPANSSVLGVTASTSLSIAGVATAAPTVSTPARRAFLGAFFRPQGPPPYGVFLASAAQTAPEPYPSPSSVLFGSKGYCDAIAANGVSISSGYRVDPVKLSNVVDLGVGWTRMPVSAMFDDLSHIYGAGHYNFADLDSAQCALLRHHITPLIALEAGPVQYNTVAGQISPAVSQQYKTAADFGKWCSTVAAHEVATFAAVNRYSLPGNEVNTDPQSFPGGEAGIAAYSEACYQAVKAVQPHSTIYGFELNMDGALNPVASVFVQQLYALGCRVGTCYDGLSIHLSLRYPIPAAAVPCYPSPKGDYGMQCVASIRSAAHAAIHLIIGETGYVVPASVPDETAKAKATVAEFRIFEADPLIDGALYANVDECAVYPSGYFVGGCLVNTKGMRLPAFFALRDLFESSQ